MMKIETVNNKDIVISIDHRELLTTKVESFIR